MRDPSPASLFRLSPGGVDCDQGGLRVRDIPLLTRDQKGSWTARDARDLGLRLSRVYGFRVDVSAKMNGFAGVAKALQERNIPKAQIAALLLRLPDPLPFMGTELAKSDVRRLSHDLIVSGLLKAEDDWDEKHPRTGSPPNPGWFAPKPKDSAATEAPRTDVKPSDSAPSTGDAARTDHAFLRPPLSSGAGSVLAEDLSASAIDGLIALAARVSVPTILFGAIFIPGANHVVDEGPVPGRPDMRYRWAHDEATVSFQALLDGQWRTFAYGRRRQGTEFYGPDGEIVARMVEGSRRRQTLVTSADVLDSALENLRHDSGKPAGTPKEDEDEPRLCPRPVNEPMTTQSKNSIAYQEYVTKLRYGLAIWLGGVFFDGCDPRTGILLEAKADIDFLMDANDEWYEWAEENNPRFQMERQAIAAAAAGRIVVWHAQTQKGFRGLSKIAEKLGKTNLSVVYDPN